MEPVRELNYFKELKNQSAKPARKFFDSEVQILLFQI